MNKHNDRPAHIRIRESRTDEEKAAMVQKAKLMKIAEFDQASRECQLALESINHWFVQFGRSSDWTDPQIEWSNISDLNYVKTQLKEIKDFLYKTGE